MDLLHFVFFDCVPTNQRSNEFLLLENSLRLSLSLICKQDEQNLWQVPLSLRPHGCFFNLSIRSALTKVKITRLCFNPCFIRNGLYCSRHTTTTGICALWCLTYLNRRFFWIFNKSNVDNNVCKFHEKYICFYIKQWIKPTQKCITRCHCKLNFKRLAYLIITLCSAFRFINSFQNDCVLGVNYE